MSEMCSHYNECAIIVIGYDFMAFIMDNTRTRRNEKFYIFLFIVCEVARNFVAVRKI